MKGWGLRGQKGKETKEGFLEEGELTLCPAIQVGFMQEGHLRERGGRGVGPL